MYNPSKPYKEQILNLISETWDTPFITVEKGIYPIFKETFDYKKVDHTDGIGTKGDYHWQKKTLKNATLDAMAMNLNDLALVRAVPYKLQNHITIPEDDRGYILDVVGVLSEECKKMNIAITGGETSIHENIPTIDISITVSGFIKNLKSNMCKAGDVLIGIKSSGLHSNGFTKVREVFGDEFRDEFTHPTKIYLDEVLDVCDRYRVNGMMHITGGAFTKLKDISKDVDINIYKNDNLLPQDIFYEIYNKGVTDKDMYKTFNCGIGFILSVPRNEKDKIISDVTDAYEIGSVSAGNGTILIESSFSRSIVKY